MEGAISDSNAYISCLTDERVYESVQVYSKPKGREGYHQGITVCPYQWFPFLPVTMGQVHKGKGIKALVIRLSGRS